MPTEDPFINKDMVLADFFYGYLLAKKLTQETRYEYTFWATGKLFLRETSSLSLLTSLFINVGCLDTIVTFLLQQFGSLT